MVVALALVSAVLICVALTLSSGMRLVRASRAELVAYQATEAVVASMRATPFALVHARFWSDPALTVQSVAGCDVVTSGDSEGALAEVVDRVLDPAYSSGVMKPPARGPALTLRFLNEAEAAEAWGTTVDLDSSGAIESAPLSPGSGAPDPGFTYYPVVVEIRWRDETGSRRVTLLATLNKEAPLDPLRQ